ncbi:MAG: FkbM family methyltransferase [Magnetococcales bacterium]|nr:FkbM family methyltransferase [Magnetococcales bacterium]
MRTTPADISIESVQSLFTSWAEQERTLFSIRLLSTPEPQPVSCRTFLKLCQRWATVITTCPDRIIPIFGHMTPEMLAAWWGTILAGRQPVFISYSTIKISAEDFQSKLDNYRASFGNLAFIGLESDRAFTQSAQLITPDSLPDWHEDMNRLRPPQSHGAPLFIQCSSGSTGVQKSVAIDAERLHAQLSAYAQSLALNPSDDLIVSWLPLYHDMGLIATFLLPMMTQTPAIFLDTFQWVGQPDLLLETIQHSRATLCWLPNFAFSLLCRSTADFDLSSMRCFINCSEPVTERAFERFINHHAVRPDQLGISYALAENVFAATQTTICQPPHCLTLSQGALGQHQVDILSEQTVNSESSPCQPGEIRLFSCGTAITGVDIRIDASDPHQIGEILLKGPSTIPHYLGQSEPRSDGWFPTGDLGFIHGDQLYISGRSKDLIIHNGKNIYPQDLENSVNAHPAIHKGRVVAIGYFDKALDSEQILLLFEPSKPMDISEKNQLCETLRQKISVHFDIQANLVAVPRMWLKKTSSGKIARQANLDAFKRIKHRTIQIIGDSHVRIFWRTPKAHQSLYEGLEAHWVGVLWSQNWIKAAPFIEELHQKSASEDLFIITTGEPECRTYFPQAEDPIKAIDQAIAQYEQFFTLLLSWRPGQVAFMTGIPTHPENIDNQDQAWPVCGTPKQRYLWQGMFYGKMAQLCHKLHMPFIDICSPLIGKNGLMDAGRLMDYAHLSLNHRQFYFNQMDQSIGFINMRPKINNDRLMVWDGSRAHFYEMTRAFVIEKSSLSNPDLEHIVDGQVLDSLGLAGFIGFLETSFQARIELNQVSPIDLNSITTIWNKFIKDKSEAEIITDPTHLAQSDFMRLRPCLYGPLLYNINDIYLGRALDQYGQYAQEALELLERIIRPGQTIIDVGAFMGTHTVALARMTGANGRVVAYEPQRIPYQTLCTNVMLNQMTHVRCHPWAVGQENGSLTIPELNAKQPNNFAGLSLMQPMSGTPTRVVTLDETNTRCQLLHIDVEGMEWMVIQGAQNLIQNQRPFIYIRNISRAVTADITRWLRARDYKTVVHGVRLFSADNFRNNTENSFANLTYTNLFFHPKEHVVDLSGLAVKRHEKKQSSH